MSKNYKFTTLTLEKVGKAIVINCPLPDLSVKAAFNKEELEAFYNEMFTLATKIWPDLALKPVTSMGNDYYEYYDSKYDGNGYISISSDKNNTELRIERPYEGVPYLYKINKVKTQTFLYDLKNIIDRKS